MFAYVAYRWGQDGHCPSRANILPITTLRQITQDGDRTPQECLLSVKSRRLQVNYSLSSNTHSKYISQITISITSLTLSWTLYMPTQRAFLGIIHTLISRGTSHSCWDYQHSSAQLTILSWFSVFR